jgi:RNA 2',3'-cyclic 3'-phosphodiesterase
MPPEPTLRTFIAIELDPEVRDALSRVQGKLKRGSPDGAVKWVNPESIHLTLKFLGDTPVSKVSKVADAVATAREGIAAFDLSIEGRGCFPNCRRPRVIWVAVKDLSGSNLLRMQAAIERLVSPLGLPTEDRGFSPHLTLGRIARNVSPATEAAVGKLVQDSVVEQIAQQRVTAVSLIKSDLRPAGPVYYTLATAKLGELEDSPDGLQAEA